MATTTLQFNSLFDLWNFRVRVHALHVFIQAANKLLICQLTEKEIRFARRWYRATIMSSC